MARKKEGTLDKPKFYSLNNILKRKARYNIIIGERSNGKTYACLEYGMKRYFASDGREHFCILRRWQDDFKGKRGQQMFAPFCETGKVYELSGGQWDDIYYWSGRWYFCTYDENGKRIKAEYPFCYAFAITSMEHDKSTSYPLITTVIYDEFLTRQAYLPDEFILFCNVLSTIIRERDNIKIFMLGNTVNKYSPYFREMGLKNIDKMKKGEIDLYEYPREEGESLFVAVEYAGSVSKSGKKSDVYFAFNNEKLKMITGGDWELEMYPHLPEKYVPNEVLFTYFINFSDVMLQCEIILKNNAYFTYIHLKTSELKDPDKDLVFSPVYDMRENWCRDLLHPSNKVAKKVKDFFVREKVFYQDNEVGEVVRNYLQWCRTA